MDFCAVLDQALTLLRQRGRVSYRTLQRQFDLDDASLADLKDALVFAEPCVVDEEGRGLVWTGMLSAAEPDTGQRADAERQLHTLLLAVTALLQREQRVTYRTLHYVFGVDEACLHAVRDELCFRQLAREEGGQGLVWTGEERPHAANATAASHAAGATAMVLSAVPPRPPLHLPAVSRPLPGPTPALDEVSSPSLEDLVPRIPDDGPAITPELARSAPDAERRQLTVLFCDLVGSTQLSGQLDPEDLRMVVRAYQEAAAEVVQPYGGHIAQYLGDGLLVYFGYPAAHEDDVRRAVLTGLGIVQAIATLNTRLAVQYSVQLAVRLGIHTGRVVVGVMGGAGRHEHLALGETPNIAARLQALAPANAVVISAVTARLVQGTFALEDLGTHALHGVAEAERQPVLVAWEDLHWADPTTLEALGLVIEQAPTVPMLHVLTYRPEFDPPWPQRSHITPLVLNRLERPQVEALIAQRALYKDLPAEVVQHIVAKTDGVPLYVEELTKMLLVSALLREEADQYVLTGSLRTVAIPDTLQDALMARLDQLNRAKEVAQFGAVLGREFAYELLQAIAPQDEDTLQTGLAQLVAAELLYQRGRLPRARYLFKHALTQDAAYASLLKSTRQQVHQQVAQVLETQFPALVETQPELVAQHYTAAGCTEQAVHYWQRAGQQASDRSAHLEAIRHLTTGIELLTTLPETPERTQHAVTLYIALGAAMQMAKGQAAPEAEHAYSQARALCQQVGETPQLIPVLFGLWRFYIARPQLHTAQELGETLLRLAQRAPDPALAGVAHYALGTTWFHLSALPAARMHLEAGIALYTPDQRRVPVFRQGLEPGVACRANAARALWVLGYPEQALVHSHEALTLAHELSHAYSLVFAQWLAAIVSQVRRDVLAVYEQAEAAVTLSTAQGFPQWAAYGTSLCGWALDVASRQEAKSLELRAAMSLARLWQQQGKQAEARALLAPIYGWFTEGFDTADLQEAKALLNALGEEP